MLIHRLLLIGLLLTNINCSKTHQWFRGNTHCHTLNSDGDSPPETLTKWYYDHNYNFLVITDHNKLIDPIKVSLPENGRKNFLLIPGEEITGAKTIHTTAMNINRIVPWHYDHKEKSAIIQNHVNGTIEAAGIAILNHPNFHYAVSGKDMLPVKDLHLFELFNGHPYVNNSGDPEHSSTEEIWDELLTSGMEIYGVASDDTHVLKDFSANKANPGRGWIMVYASELNPDKITNAIARGDFYASTGIFLKKCDRTADDYVIEVDKKKTHKELASFSDLCGRPVDSGTEGYKIEFIGPNGRVLSPIKGSKGTYRVKKSDAYVRAKVTLTLKQQNSGYKEYYAWGQPVFNDERIIKDL